MRLLILLCILCACAKRDSYPNLGKGPTEDQKPPISFEKVKAELDQMASERDALKGS